MIIYNPLSLEEWKSQVEYHSQLKKQYRELKKERKLSRKQEKIVKYILKKQTLFLWANAPHIKNNKKRIERVYEVCQAELKAEPI